MHLLCATHTLAPLGALSAQIPRLHLPGHGKRPAPGGVGDAALDHVAVAVAPVLAAEPPDLPPGRVFNKKKYNK